MKVEIHFLSTLFEGQSALYFNTSIGCHTGSISAITRDTDVKHIAHPLFTRYIHLETEGDETVSFGVCLCHCCTSDKTIYTYFTF